MTHCPECLSLDRSTRLVKSPSQLFYEPWVHVKRSAFLGTLVLNWQCSEHRVVCAVSGGRRGWGGEPARRRTSRTRRPAAPCTIWSRPSSARRAHRTSCSRAASSPLLGSVTSIENLEKIFSLHSVNIIISQYMTKRC